MITSRLLKYVFSALILMNLSCQKTTSVSSEIKIQHQQQSQIINGTLVTTNDPLSKHIVLIHDVQNGSVCTGVIVMKNMILTAAHCIHNVTSAYRILFSTDAYDLMDHPQKELARRASKIIVHKDYVSDENKQPPMNQSDIAVLYFDDGLPEGYTPVEVLYDQSELKKGQNIIVAGYGVSEVKSFEVPYKNSESFKEKIKYGEVICDADIKTVYGLPTCLDVTMSGDGILRKTNTQIKYTTESEFVLDEKLKGTCSGDSGGPALIEKNGIYYLVGLTSRGSFLCDDEGIYTMTSYHLEWILSH